MTVLVPPLILVFTALTVLVFAFGARRLLGLRFSFLRTLIAGALAFALSYPLLAMLGFRPAEGAANSHQALLGLELAYFIGPIFFVMLGGLCFIGWRLTADRHGEIRRQLDARDAALSDEPSN